MSESLGYVSMRAYVHDLASHHSFFLQDGLSFLDFPDPIGTGDHTGGPGKLDALGRRHDAEAIAAGLGVDGQIAGLGGAHSLEAADCWAKWSRSLHHMKVVLPHPPQGRVSEGEVEKHGANG